MDIKPIETVYNGYRFRSRLEARWAVFFDSHGIPYIPEPEGLNINGICYLPDFYLPDCKQFFEVKGVMDSDSEEKINALIKAGYSVTVGYDDGRFQACDNWSYPEESPTFELSNDSGLFQCTACGKYWFMGNTGIWTCQCCGTHDGDHHLIPIMYCYRDKYGVWHDPDRKEWDIARQARFEHGETPQVSTKTNRIVKCPLHEYVFTCEGCKYERNQQCDCGVKIGWNGDSVIGLYPDYQT